MAKFTLTTDSDSEELAFQLEMSPPPIFKSIDDATDWALTNFPYGVYIEIRDGRRTLRASGINAGKIEIHKLKPINLCDCDKYDYCRVHGSMP